jgi:molybdopterin synthase sulfur carrier subunit
LSGSMARVIVKMFATVREAAGTDSVQVEAENVLELLETLKSMFGVRFSRTVSDLGSDQDRIVILINGRNPGRALALSRDLSEGDEVAIFPPVSGG